jgi:DNA-binding response OmpR family regulator
MTDALDTSGYRVWHAATGAEATAMLARNTPDLIVLDLLLPDEDGLVLCNRLKQMAPTPSLSAAPLRTNGMPSLA